MHFEYLCGSGKMPELRISAFALAHFRTTVIRPIPLRDMDLRHYKWSMSVPDEWVKRVDEAFEGAHAARWGVSIDARAHYLSDGMHGVIFERLRRHEGESWEGVPPPIMGIGANYATAGAPAMDSARHWLDRPPSGRPLAFTLVLSEQEGWTVSFDGRFREWLRPVIPALADLPVLSSDTVRLALMRAGTGDEADASPRVVSDRLRTMARYRLIEPLDSVLPTRAYEELNATLHEWLDLQGFRRTRRRPPVVYASAIWRLSQPVRFPEYF